MNFLDFPYTILEISIQFALSRFFANFGLKILFVNLSCVTESCFFCFVGESGNCLDDVVSFGAVIRVVTQRSSCVTTLITAAKETIDDGEHERLCRENDASPSTLVILGLTDVREWRQSIKEEISID